MSIVRIETLGCRLNQIESESAARFFLENNFSVSMAGFSAKSPVDEETLVCIINTCTVTQKAEQKARRIIRLMLKKYPNAAIIVTGCYAQLSKDEIKSFSPRIAVLPGQIKSRISKVPEYLKNQTDFNACLFVKQLEAFFDLPQQKPGFPENSFELSTSSFLAHSRASLKIQDGCNNACSYCAIHFARGHSVSIDVETAVKRVQELEKAGQEEVVITSINIAQYRGKNGEETFNFSQLLQKLLDSTHNISFRISSLYPEIVDEQFCSVIANKRVRPHFHISVQSGSDSVLKAMNRVYNKADVAKACKMLQKAKPDVFLACDIITGFPGETDSDFEQTMELCKECNFAWVHAFPFSERPGTPAAKMKNKVPQSVSGERAKKITSWAIAQKIEYISKYEGKSVSAIVETSRNNCSKADKANAFYTYHCMTENFIHCEFSTDKPVEMNKSVIVEIQKPLVERIKKGGEIEALASIKI